MKYKLKDILDKYIRGPFGSSLKRGEMKSEGIPVYEQQNAIYNHREFRFFIDNKKFNELKRFQVKTGDLIISCSGTLGRISLISEDDQKGIISQALLILRPNTDLILPEYLYYFFKSDYGYKSLLSRSSGSVQVNLAKREVIEDIDIFVPRIDIQNKIVKILKSIDEKIVLNNKINNNLFELLKQKFKEKFYNNEVKDSCLIDYISETIGGDWGKDTPEGNNNTKVYCVRGADIPSMEYGNKGNAPIRYILEKNYNKKKLDPNNIIIEISGGSPTQSTGRTAYITKNIIDMYDSPLLCTNFCRAIEAKKDILAPFIYMNLKIMYEDGIFFNWENGTTGIKNLALNDMLSNLEVKSPKENDLNDYCVLFNNIMNKISSNSNENLKLEQLRYTLLPKLMNGEIDLDNIKI